MKYHFKQNSHFMRSVLLLTLFAAAVLTAHADGIGIRTVTLTVNGVQRVFNLDEKPVITFSDNKLHIKTETESTDVDVTDVSVVEFKGAPDRADANGDNKIDVADIHKVANHIVGKEDVQEPWGADANGDNKIDIADLTEIIRKIINNH